MGDLETILWAVVAALAFVGELLSLSFFLLFFALGAAVALVAALLGAKTNASPRQTVRRARRNREIERRYKPGGAGLAKSKEPLRDRWSENHPFDGASHPFGGGKPKVGVGNCVCGKAFWYLWV